MLRASPFSATLSLAQSVGPSMNQVAHKRARTYPASGLMALSERADGATLTDHLFQAMRRLILDGVWRHGERIPGSRILARDAKVSRSTLVATVEMMVAEGLLETRGKSGTYVAWTRTLPAAKPATGEQAPFTAPHLAPFSVGAPGLDLFPLKIWRRLQARRWSTMPLAALDDGDEAGLLELRAAIAQHVDASRGIKCGAHQVVIMSSAQSAVHLATLVLAERGAQVWTEEPGYFGTPSAMRAVGAEPIPVPVDEEGIVVDKGIALAPSATLAVVTPACQFPLGVPMSLARRKQLLSWARNRRSWIIEDDYDSEFPCTKNVPRPLAAGPDSRVIYVNTFSKTLFPALRLAYLIVPEVLVDRFIAARRGVDRNTTVPNQMVLADFLDTGQFAKHLRRCREAYRERRVVMVEGIKREFGAALSLRENLPGLHICATYQGSADDADLAALARKHGIVVEPLKRFFAGTPACRGLLLGYSGFTAPVIRAQLRALARVLKPVFKS
jgi:GntR family transcriptional regulator/MocR family aminotransferase